MKPEQKLSAYKVKYQKEGFLLLGYFGSRARGDHSESSDLDILYQVNDSFVNQYSGFDYFDRIDRIRRELSQELGRDVDLVNKGSLGPVGQYFIIPEVVYVS